MGNTTTNNSEEYHDCRYTTLNWLESSVVKFKIFDDDYFIKSPQKNI